MSTDETDLAERRTVAPPHVLAALRLAPTPEELLARSMRGDAAPTEVDAAVFERLINVLQVAPEALALLSETAERSPAEQMAHHADQQDMLIELLKGYRAKLVASGFAEDNAELMTVAMHQSLMLNQQHHHHHR